MRRWKLEGVFESGAGREIVIESVGSEFWV